MQRRDLVQEHDTVAIINSKQNVILDTDKGGFTAVEWFVGWL